MDSATESRVSPFEVWQRISLRSRNAIVLVCFSIFYFSDVLIRASEKTFWYDELLTLYFARFKNIHVLWAALKTGVESNPPIFHFLTRLAEAPFGEGLIATRLPEIISFWILCLCLFHFVQRRAGTVAGFLAMTIPMLSGAYFYAYEARPLGIVMSFAGVALVYWDHANSSIDERRWWLTALSGAILFALGMHGYAFLILIPFGLAEAVRTVRDREFRWDMWLAMGAPLLPALVLYIPLLRSFSAYTKNSDFLSAFPTVWPLVPQFYIFLAKDSALLFTILVVLIALHACYPAKHLEPTRTPVLLDVYDLTVCLGFIGLPVVGVGLARALHTTSFPRYFLSAIIGFSVMMAIGLSGFEQRYEHTGELGAQYRKRPWIAKLAAAAVIVALLSSFVRMARHRNKEQAEITPVTMYTDQTLIKNMRVLKEPMAVLDARDFLYLLHYDPELRPWLYAVDRTPRGMNFYGPEKMRPWLPIIYNSPLTETAFSEQHALGYVYGSIYQIGELARFTKHAVVNDVKSDGIHFLAHTTPAHSGE